MDSIDACAHESPCIEWANGQWEEKSSFILSPSFSFSFYPLSLSLSPPLSFRVHTHTHTHTSGHSRHAIERLQGSKNWADSATGHCEKLELNSSQLEHWPSIGLLIRTLSLSRPSQFALTLCILHTQSTNGAKLGSAWSASSMNFCALCFLSLPD